MQRTYHFISGLPRSGSTLLSSILNQNPRFYASISDCVQQYAHAIIRETEASVGVPVLVPPAKRIEVIRGIFDSYYSDKSEVCFNTNRGWSGDTAFLKQIYPDFKMIVMLRDVRWVLNSFEVLHQKTPLTLKPLYHNQDVQSVYDRTQMLMGDIPNFGGYVSGPLAGVNASFASAEKDNILYVTYAALVKQPEKTLKAIYAFLGETYYQHDFNNVAASYDEFDAHAKIQGLHTIRKAVAAKKQPVLIPPDLWEKYASANSWLHINKSKYNFIDL